MILHDPQIIMFSLLLIGAGISMANNGQKQTGTYNVVDWLIGSCIVAGLLWWGGFWTGGVCVL